MVEFKQHPRFPNIVCSSDGRVFIHKKGWRRGGPDGITYLAIDWWVGPRSDKVNRIVQYIHRLVAETFGESIMSMDVDHLDFNKQNNNCHNLKASHASDNRGRSSKGK